MGHELREGQTQQHTIVWQRVIIMQQHHFNFEAGLLFCCKFYPHGLNALFFKNCSSMYVPLSFLFWMNFKYNLSGISNRNLQLNYRFIENSFTNFNSKLLQKKNNIHFDSQTDLFVCHVSANSAAISHWRKLKNLYFLHVKRCNTRVVKALHKKDINLAIF